MTSIAPWRDTPVDALSGGQRQRVWIAMTVAQQNQIIFLDEPTTYLDIAHQLDVLELLRKLNRAHGRTIVMVLHDLNLAARYSNRIVTLRDGRIVADGAPRDVITPSILHRVFEIEAEIHDDPVSGYRGRFPDRSSPHKTPKNRSLWKEVCRSQLPPAEAGGLLKASPVDQGKLVANPLR